VQPDVTSGRRPRPMLIAGISRHAGKTVRIASFAF
jgi:hypothetical protein